MAGHALRGNFMSVDYKEVEHSNHVYRSFIYVINQCGFHIEWRGLFQFPPFCWTYMYYI